MNAKSSQVIETTKNPGKQAAGARCFGTSRLAQDEQSLGGTEVSNTCVFNANVTQQPLECFSVVQTRLTRSGAQALCDMLKVNTTLKVIRYNLPYYTQPSLFNELYLLQLIGRMEIVCDL